MNLRSIFFFFQNVDGLDASMQKEVFKKMDPRYYGFLWRFCTKFCGNICVSQLRQGGLPEAKKRKKRSKWGIFGPKKYYSNFIASSRPVLTKKKGEGEGVIKRKKKKI